MCLCMSKHVSACVYTYVWWAVCFKIVDSKNAVCVPTNRDYIDSMVNKIALSLQGPKGQKGWAGQNARHGARGFPGPKVSEFTLLSITFVFVAV